MKRVDSAYHKLRNAKKFSVFPAC